jgi:acyl dehydratase
MAIGFGLAPFTGGMSAALITGAGYTAATGSLKKGIMAGLGAYGGAGLAGGLSAMGASAVAPAQAGLSPAVAANTSTAAANNVFANVGSQPLALTDDILAGVAKTPIAPPGQAMAFQPTSALNQTVAAATTTPPSVVPATGPIHSGGVSMPPSALRGATGSPVDIPAPTAGPAVLSREPSALITGDVTKPWSATLPRPAKEFSLYEHQVAGKVPDVAYDRMVSSTGSYTPTPVANLSNYSAPLPAPSGAVDVSGQAAANAQAGASSPYVDYMKQVGRGAKNVYRGGMQGLKDLYAAQEAAAPYSGIAGLGATAMGYYDERREKMLEEMRRRAGQSTGLIRPYEFAYNPTGVASEPYSGSAERLHFNPMFTARTPYAAPGPEYAAEGGLMGYAVGGPVEQMSAMNSVGANTGYPMASINTPVYANPAIQRPEAMNVLAPSADAGVGAYTGEARFADGGISHLGDYSDGGRLLKGPGDGVSDSIPASIGNRQPARLADGEFVIPARIVSEIGNGSTEAGARKLYAMMDRVQKARRKTTGKNKVAVNTKAEKLLPA